MSGAGPFDQVPPPPLNSSVSGLRRASTTSCQEVVSTVVFACRSFDLLVAAYIALVGRRWDARETSGTSAAEAR